MIKVLKRHIIRLLTIAIIWIGAGSLYAQDIHFSQFYMSPLNLNPALTGVMECQHRFVANYRNQWSSILGAKKAYSTYSVSYDQRFQLGRHNSLGLGGKLWGDQAGTSSFKTIQGNLSIAYDLRLGGSKRGKTSHHLVAGSEVGFSQRGIDIQKLQFSSQHDGEGNFNGNLTSGELLDRTNFTFLDASAGLMWYSILNQHSIYGGAALSHLNRPNQSFFSDNIEDLYYKLTLHAGGNLSISDRINLFPNVVLLQQGPSFELNAGLATRLRMKQDKRNSKYVRFGLWGRVSNDPEDSYFFDALILTTRFDLGKMSIGFSYDVNVSRLVPATNSFGSFEFALIYNICRENKNGRIYCPFE